ncbi:ribonuclease H-like domain-containing protein, partial [Amylocarpus encephaloides]
MVVDDDDDGEPSTKRKKVEEVVKGKSKGKGGLLKVWTDGSSRGNGRASAQAGYGVWFGEGDDRNVAARLPGLPQTNQRAELTGMLRALEIVPTSQPLEIISDSNYSINCATIWYKGWTKNGWKSSTGQTVLNRDIVEKIRAVMDQRDKAGVETRCTWVKGHNEDVGNTGADELAVAGSRLPAL